MSFHDPFNSSVCRSNQNDAVPSKNSGRKLSHSAAVLSLVPIQARLYSLKNTSGSSPLLPSENWNNHIDYYFVSKEKLAKLINSFNQLSL